MKPSKPPYCEILSIFQETPRNPPTTTSNRLKPLHDMHFELTQYSRETSLDLADAQKPFG